MELNGINTSLNNEVNGCGACKGLFKFLKPPHPKFFKEQCNIHDEHYNIGGNRIDRKISDLILYRDMIKLVKKYFYKRKPLSKLWYLILCRVYYIGVRLGGWLSFNYK